MRRKFQAGLIIASLILGISKTAYSALINCTFSDYPGFVYSNPSSISNIEEEAQNWYKTYYGITFDHAYFYSDSRDTFDGIGVSNGWITETFMPNISGIINFVKKTDFVTVDAMSLGQNVTFSIFDKNDRLLDSYIAPINGNYSFTFESKGISYLKFTSLGGYVGLSGISYDHKGFIPDVPNVAAPVPEPATVLLFTIGLAGLTVMGRRKK